MPAKENNIVKRTPELSEPPRLNAGQKLRLGAVLPMPDEQIDYSDAPVLPDTVWMKAAEQYWRYWHLVWSLNNRLRTTVLA